jgi:transposase InsO family protein
LFAWSARTGVRLRFIQPGKPIPNAFVESFIGRLKPGWRRVIRARRSNRANGQLKSPNQHR